MARVYGGEPIVLRPRPRAGRARLLPPAAAPTPTREQDWKGYARSVLVFSAVSLVALYLILRTQAIHPLNPQGFGAGAVGPLVQHRRVVRDEHELAVLRRRDDDVVLHADGRPGGAELRLRRRRHRGRSSPSSAASPRRERHDARQLLGRPDARASLYVLLPICDRRRAVPRRRRASSRRSADRSTSTTLRAAQQTLALGPVASQEAIKQLGTNGGGFFNVNSAHAVREPDGVHELRLDAARSSSIPAGLDGDVRPHGRQPRARAGRSTSAMIVLFVAGVAVVYAAESATDPGAARRPGIAGGNMEGKEMRFGIGSTRAVRGRHDRRLVRRGQRGDGVADGARRRVPMANMMTGEVDLRRRRLRPLRDAAVRPARRLPRRADGRPHARVPRQEDRGARDQARRASARSRVPLLVLVVDRRWRSRPSTARRRSSTPGRRASPRRSTPTSRRRNNNGSAFAGYTGFVQPNGGNDGAFGITFADVLGGVVDARSGASSRCSPCSRSPASLAGKRVAPAGPGTMRTDTPTFVVLLDRRRSCSSRS